MVFYRLNVWPLSTVQTDRHTERQTGIKLNIASSLNIEKWGHFCLNVIWRASLPLIHNNIMC